MKAVKSVAESGRYFEVVVYYEGIGEVKLYTFSLPEKVENLYIYGHIPKFYKNDGDLFNTLDCYADIGIMLHLLKYKV